MTKTKGYLIFILAFTAITNIIVSLLFPNYSVAKYGFAEVYWLNVLPYCKTNYWLVVHSVYLTVSLSDYVASDVVLDLILSIDLL